MDDLAGAVEVTTFESFYADHFEGAVRAAYLLTYSSAVAEDIAQDAFAQVLRRWSEIRRPSAYLWRAVLSGARSWGRRERRAVRAERREDVEFNNDVLAVRAALATLSRPQREVLVLRHYLGLYDREIAEAMGCPLGTVKSHAHRARHALKEALS
jgi:RNA polymerase sigma factor (sigma-70 family)